MATKKEKMSMITLENLNSWKQVAISVFEENGKVTTNLIKQNSDADVFGTHKLLLDLGYISPVINKDDKVDKDDKQIFIPWHNNSYYPDKTIDALKNLISQPRIDTKDYLKLEAKLDNIENLLVALMNKLGIEEKPKEYSITDKVKVYDIIYKNKDCSLWERDLRKVLTNEEAKDLLKRIIDCIKNFEPEFGYSDEVDLSDIKLQQDIDNEIEIFFDEKTMNINHLY